MSKWRNGHGESEGRGSDPQTWRDEPWLAALLRLVEKDAWVGTDERLLDELKAPAVEGRYRSSDSPAPSTNCTPTSPRPAESLVGWTLMFWTTVTYLVIP
jgi:hypothetical protein